jgi:hypothetical protein
MAYQKGFWFPSSINRPSDSKREQGIFMVFLSSFSVCCWTKLGEGEKLQRVGEKAKSCALEHEGVGLLYTELDGQDLFELELIKGWDRISVGSKF